MDVDRATVSKIIEDGEIREALDAKVTPEFFEDDQCADVYRWLVEHWQEYGKVPGPDALKANHPTFKKVRTEEPLAYYISELQGARSYAIMQDTVSGASKALKDRNLDLAQEMLADGVSQLNREVSALRDIDLSTNTDERLERYRSYKDLPGGLRGLPTGFHIIDRATLGLQAEQLISLVGLPKSGKSTIALLIAMAVQDYGKRPLFIGFEMSNEEQQARYDAFRAKVNWQKLMSGTLGPKEEGRLKRSLKESASRCSFMLSADISATTTVSGLAAKVEEHKPDLLIVDGVYMMESEIPGVEPESPRALTSITRGIKRLAQRARIPVVITTQVLPGKFSARRGITIDSIGYTSSFAQDSDVILGVESTEDEDQKRLKIVAARNTRNQSVLLNWSWDTAEFEELEEDMDYDSDYESP